MSVYHGYSVQYVKTEDHKTNLHLKKVLMNHSTTLPSPPFPLLLLCREIFLSNHNTMASSLPAINQSLPPILALSSNTNFHARQIC